MSMNQRAEAPPYFVQMSTQRVYMNVSTLGEDLKVVLEKHLPGEQLFENGEPFFPIDQLVALFDANDEVSAQSAKAIEMLTIISERILSEYRNALKKKAH